MEEKNNVTVEYQIGEEYLNPSEDTQTPVSSDVNEVIKEQIIEIEATNNEAKEMYDEAYADRYEYLTKKKHLTEEQADKRARAVAAHTVIMSSLDTRRDYIMTDTIEYETLKNYDVYVPTTIVGCLRHPFMIKQVYKKTNQYGDDYQVSIEWYDEETDELRTDTWTLPVKSPEYGTQWSGDVIVPYEIAVALKDCYDNHFGNKMIDKTYSRAEHYYIHKYFDSGKDGWSYNNGEKIFKQGDLITGQELKKLHNSVVGTAAIYAPTYLDVMNWMTKCTRNKFAFIIDYVGTNEDDKKNWFVPKFFNFNEELKMGYLTCSSFEECCIKTIDWIFSQGGFHPFYTWYDDKLTEKAVTKIYNDGFWTAEECEIYTGISPILKSKAMKTPKTV